MDLKDLQTFVSVAELGSFSAASETENLPPSSVTRRIKKLEDQLGTQLFDRTTRVVALTEDGQLFYQRARQVLGDLDDVQRVLHGRQTHPEGTLRIGGAEELLATDILGHLHSFAIQQPQLKIDIHPGTDVRNIYTKNLDVMFHIDEPNDSDLIAHHLTTATTNYYANPDYLERNETLREPEDILKHRCIVEQRNWLSNVNHWPFKVKSKVVEFPVTPHYRAESTLICVRLAAAGLGIALLPDHHCKNYVESGKLVKLFNGEHEFNHSLYTLYPKRRYLPLKVQVLIDFLREEMPASL